MVGVRARAMGLGPPENQHHFWINVAWKLSEPHLEVMDMGTTEG